MSSRSPTSLRSSSCPSPSQAKLLRGRGELRGKRAAFNVQLPEPTPLALQAANAFDRIGLELRRADVPGRLLVENVDCNPRKKTPVARFNMEEERRANRGEEEQHASFALLPGDRLRAVNEVNGQTAMIAELVEAMNNNSPKEVCLAISRDITDVMAPSPSRSRSYLSGTPATPPVGRPPRPRTGSESVPTLRATEPTTPWRNMAPHTPVRSATCGSASRSASTSSLSSARSRSGSRRPSPGNVVGLPSLRRPSSGGSPLGIGVALSHAGRVALAF